MGSLTVSPDWQAELRADVNAFLDGKLGPDIAGDARRYAPVGPSFAGDPAHPRTPPHEGGELKASIEHHMEGDELIVEAHAPYAYWVETGTSPHEITAHGRWSLWSPEAGYLGHTVLHPGTPAQSFLRAALYQPRTY